MATNSNWVNCMGYQANQKRRAGRSKTAIIGMDAANYEFRPSHVTTNSPFGAWVLKWDNTSAKVPVMVSSNFLVSSRETEILWVWGSTISDSCSRVFTSLCGLS